MGTKCHLSYQDYGNIFWVEHFGYDQDVPQKNVGDSLLKFATQSVHNVWRLSASD
jgi:hypothetical protein